MKFSLFIATLFPFIVRAADDLACPTPPEFGICLYTCEPTPTILYTTTSLTTRTRILPCPTLITEPGPEKAKRTVASCPPYTKPVGCGSCPTVTAAETSVTTVVSTVTKYKTCSTSTKPKPTPTPTLYPVV